MSIRKSLRILIVLLTPPPPPPPHHHQSVCNQAFSVLGAWPTRTWPPSSPSLPTSSPFRQSNATPRRSRPTWSQSQSAAAVAAGQAVVAGSPPVRIGARHLNSSPPVILRSAAPSRGPLRGSPTRVDRSPPRLCGNWLSRGPRARPPPPEWPHGGAPVGVGLQRPAWWGGEGGGGRGESAAAHAPEAVAAGTEALAVGQAAAVGEPRRGPGCLGGVGGSATGATPGSRRCPVCAPAPRGERPCGGGWLPVVVHAPAISGRAGSARRVVEALTSPPRPPALLPSPHSLLALTQRSVAAVGGACTATRRWGPFPHRRCGWRTRSCVLRALPRGGWRSCRSRVPRDTDRLGGSASVALAWADSRTWCGVDRGYT